MAYIPAPFGGGAEDLSGYVQRELTRIAVELDAKTGGATLARRAGDPDAATTVDTTPTILEFAEAFPPRDPRNLLPILPSSLVARQGGLWALAFTVAAEVETQGKYQVGAYIDGALGYVVAESDPSNQSTVVTFTGIGSTRIDTTLGAPVVTADLRVTADASRASTMLQKAPSASRTMRP